MHHLFHLIHFCLKLIFSKTTIKKIPIDMIVCLFNAILQITPLLIYGLIGYENYIQDLSTLHQGVLVVWYHFSHHLFQFVSQSFHQ